MSIDHTCLISIDNTTELRVNISQLDSVEKNVSEVSAHIYATCPQRGTSKFTCTLTIDHLSRLYAYLDQYEMIKDRARDTTGEFVQIAKGQDALAAILCATDREITISALKHLVKDKLSKEDVDVILGRKDAVSKFKNMLYGQVIYSEPDWQEFLESNDWIFGYGLRYKYLSILQRECHLSGTDLDGKNAVISDFLLSDNRFTKIVELKKPDTPLFKDRKNRSESWQLSGELTDAVSQILSQKAHWEHESKTPQYDDKGNVVKEKTYDVDCILLIGMSSQFDGQNKESAIKSKTIELYRRNMRNIEILFYDELYERAKFIVEGGAFCKDQLK